MFVQYYLTVLVKLILDTHFQDALCIMHLSNTTNSVSLSSPHYLIKDIDNFNLDPFKVCRNFILQCKDADECFTTVETVIKYDSDGMYNNRKYLIIINKNETFKNFFNSTWLTFVCDILIIYSPNEDILIENTNLLISEDYQISFELYTHRYIGIDSNNDPILLDIWYVRNQTFLYGNNLYPDKITNQMGREFRAACYETLPYALCTESDDVGKEHVIILKYIQKFNYTLNLFENLEEGMIFPNWTGYDTLGALLTEDIYYDIVYGGLPNIEHVDLIRSDRYIYELSVPIPKMIYGWFWTLNIFNVKIWMLAAVSIILVSLLIQLRRCYHQPVIPIIGIIGLYVSQSPPFSDNVKNSISLRYILILILFSNFMSTSLYNTRFASIMMAPEYENDIKTLSELADSDYRIIAFDSYHLILQEDTRDVYKKLFEKFIIKSFDFDKETDDLTPEIKELFTSRKNAFTRLKRSTGTYNEDEDVLILMHGQYKPIKPELFVDYYYLLLRKNSMHTYELQKLVTTAEETGLMYYWEMEGLRIVDDVTFDHMMMDVSIKSENQPLNVQKLKGVFAFWAICILISIVVFIIELSVFEEHINIPT